MINQNEQTASKIGVTLSASGLAPNMYVARVPRNNVSMDALLNSVVENNHGIDKYQISHAAELLKKEILLQIKSGKSVNVLDLGTLYLASRKGIKTLNPDKTDINGFEARFSVAKEINAALAKITASVTQIIVANPVIKEIQNPLQTDEESNPHMQNSSDRVSLKATFSARIKGRNLKLGGEESGIWFVPLTDEGVAEADESQWIKVDDEFILKNGKTVLEFHLPRELTVGTQYLILIRTRLGGSSVLKKDLLEGESPMAVVIVE